jgi:hypothetical protein
MITEKAALMLNYDDVSCNERKASIAPCTLPVFISERVSLSLVSLILNLAGWAWTDLRINVKAFDW